MSNHSFAAFRARLVAAVSGALALVTTCSSGDATPTSTAPQDMPAAVATAPGPTTLPFPCLGFEGQALHIHPYLKIDVDGAAVSVPAGIGIRGNCFEPLHTHDAGGIIHIESTVVRDYTLGDFFVIWEATYGKTLVAGDYYPVTYSPTQFLGHPIDAKHTLTLLVNGQPSPAGPDLVLNRLNYCTPADLKPPCFPTATSDPFPASLISDFGNGHTIVLRYATS